MSIKAMTWVFEQEALKGNEKLVLLALADHANDEGACWPSVERIALKASVSVRTVQRILNDLEEEGWLIRAKGDGRGHTTHYTLQFEKGAKLSPLVPERVTPEAQRVTKQATKGDTAMSHKPSRTIKNHENGFSDLRKKWVGGSEHVRAGTEAWEAWKSFFKLMDVPMPNPVMDGGYYFKTKLPPSTTNSEEAA